MHDKIAMGFCQYEKSCHVQVYVFKWRKKEVMANLNLYVVAKKCKTHTKSVPYIVWEKLPCFLKVIYRGSMNDEKVKKNPWIICKAKKCKEIRVNWHRPIKVNLP